MTASLGADVVAELERSGREPYRRSSIPPPVAAIIAGRAAGQPTRTARGRGSGPLARSARSGAGLQALLETKLIGGNLFRGLPQGKGRQELADTAASEVELER